MDNSKQDKFMNILETSGLPIELIYVLVVSTIFFISTRLVKANSAHVFALILSVFAINFIYQKSQSHISNINSELDVKMELLGNPPYFHMDANLIMLFADLLVYRRLNPNNFDLALQAVSHILKVESDVEKIALTRCVDNYEIARDQAKLSLNLVHGFVHSLTSKTTVVKLVKIIERLQQLLERHLVAITRHCDRLERNKESTDVNSRFIEDFNGPFANDPAVSEFGTFDHY